MVTSLLVHVLVIFSFGLWLHFQPAKPKERNAYNLEVKLAQPLPIKTQPKPSQKLLTTPTPAQIKIAQIPNKNLLENVRQPTTEVTGIAFPSAVAIPSQGQSHASLFRSRSSQQDATRTYYQQTMESQARQQSEQQAQLIIMQLQKLLAERLDIQPAVTGKCMLAEVDGGDRYRLFCESPAMYEVLSRDEKNVMEMLLTLRGMGRMFKGFSSAIHADRLEIILID